MPKEIVHNSTPDYPSYARVGWSRESGHVQLATANPDGKLSLKNVDGKYEPVDTIEDHGWFVSLDRHGINDLIRVLRRARDQAFGKDE